MARKRVHNYTSSRKVEEIDKAVAEWCRTRPGYPCEGCYNEKNCHRSHDCLKWELWAKAEWKQITGHE